MFKRHTLRSLLVISTLFLSPNWAVAGGDWEYEQAQLRFEAGEHTEAAELLQQAVSKGHSAARLPLAAMFREGMGVPQDYGKALKLFTISANEGYPSAQFTLGAIYRAGEGVDTNYPQAFKWFLKAARQGEEASQNNLGTMYEAGRGVSVNHVTALMWYEIAASNGSPRGKINFKRLKRKLSDDEVTRAKKLVHACLQSRYRKCG